MAPTFYYPLFLTLLLLRPPSGAAIIIPVVHIINSMPANTASVSLSCQVEEGKSVVQDYPLGVGQKYEWIAKGGATYTCKLLRANQFAIVYVYRLNRDSGHQDTFWKFDNDGFYLSYDNINYKKLAYWQANQL